MVYCFIILVALCDFIGSQDQSIKLPSVLEIKRISEQKSRMESKDIDWSNVTPRFHTSLHENNPINLLCGSQQLYVISIKVVGHIVKKTGSNRGLMYHTN